MEKELRGLQVQLVENQSYYNLKNINKIIMKKIIKKFESKKVKNLKAIKGGSNGKGTKSSASVASGRPELL